MEPKKIFSWLKVFGGVNFFKSFCFPYQWLSSFTLDLVPLSFNLFAIKLTFFQRFSSSYCFETVCNFSLCISSDPFNIIIISSR